MGTFQRVFGCLLGITWLIPKGTSAQSSATIYADGRVVKRETLVTRIPAGTTTIRLALREPDPSSLVALDPGVHVLRIRFPGSESPASLLKRAVGRRVRMLGWGDSTGGLVLSADPIRIQLASGVLIANQQWQFLFPPDLVANHDSVDVTISSDRPLERFRFGYQTNGATWRARYLIRLGRPQSAISGSALLVSDLVDLDSAEVQLYAGQIGRVERPQSLSSLRLEQLVVTTESQFGARTAGNLEATTETIGSHRVYSLPGRYQMGPGETMAVPLFEPVALMVERVHLVQSASPIGPTAPGTPGQEIPIEIQYRAERTKGTAFGDRSLPAGIVSIYDGVPGRETLIAEGQLSHTPAATPFLVNGGRALDVRAYRASSGYQIIQDSVVNPSGSMTVRATAQVETLEWTLTNGSDSVVVAELVERQPGKWRVVQSSVPPEAIVGGVRFRVTVPARGEAKASYRIRIDQDE